MKLQKDNQWATYKMSAHQYAAAIDVYNAACVLELHSEKFVLKNLRTIMEKLVEIEESCIQQITRANYKCKSHSIIGVFILI